MEEEDLPLLQRVTPSGYACDLGLSAYADDVAKKVVGRSEKELFEALELSDKVLEEEYGQEGGRADDEGRRPGFDLKHKGGIVAGANPVVKGRYVRRGSPWANSGQWRATGPRNAVIFGCKVLGAAVSAAETDAWHDSEMKEIKSLLCKYMRVMLRGRAKTVKMGE